MKFYKGCESLSFFISTYLVFILHIIFVCSISDKNYEETEGINTTLINHKKIIFGFYIFAFISHLFASFSDPGSIEPERNLEILEAYNFIYKEINKIKNKFNRLKSKEGIDDNNIEDTSHLKLFDNDDKDKTTKKEKIISEKYDFPINKCKRCKLLCPETSFHCSYCQFCILDSGGHCPWLNNCIGLFNRKSYLLFCLYSVILVGYSFLIYFYYNIFKNFQVIRHSIAQTLISIFWMFYCFLYGMFCFMLLSDERKTMLKEFKNYGEEKSALMKLKMRLIFSGNFSLKWFFPFFAGGKKYAFSFLKKKNKDNFKSKKFKKAIIKTDK